MSSDYALDLKQEVEKEEVELLEIEREMELNHCGYDDRDTTPVRMEPNAPDPWAYR